MTSSRRLFHTLRSYPAVANDQSPIETRCAGRPELYVYNISSCSCCRRCRRCRCCWEGVQICPKIQVGVSDSPLGLPWLLNYRVLISSLHRVSKNCAKLFLSQLRQISTNFDNFWQKDGKEAKIMRGALIFHLTYFASSHYCVKRRCSILLGYTTLKVVICDKLSNDLSSTQ